MQALQKLSPHEKQQFYISLSHIEDKLEGLVERFYYFFLQTDAGILFKNTNMDTHYKMFHVTLAFLIAHIDNPVLLNEHLKLVVQKHKTYGVKSEHVFYFIDSFMMALKEFFDESDERVTFIWNNVLYEIMSFFNEQLQEIRNNDESEMNVNSNNLKTSYRSLIRN